MIRPGRRSLAHRFSTHQGLTSLREQSGSRIFPSFRKGISVSGASIVYSGVDEHCNDGFIHDIRRYLDGRHDIRRHLDERQIATMHYWTFHRSWNSRLSRWRYRWEGKIYPRISGTTIGAFTLTKHFERIWQSCVQISQGLLIIPRTRFLVS